MNTNSRIKEITAKALLALAIIAAPACHMTAQEATDEFGIWGTFELSKKINKKAKVGVEAEVRSVEAVRNMERVALGAKFDYKLTGWLKANVGYVFIYGHNLEEKSIKEVVDADLGRYNYNIDDAYWAARNRVYLGLTGEYKIGRFEFTLRERLQYTHTSPATTMETKYRWEMAGGLGGDFKEVIEGPEEEKKEAKDNLSLRSRLNIKYDIPKCKITPFVSAELYTRLDKWAGYDKLRCRAGASYKINKKNSVSLYYLYQDVSGNDPDGHAIGVEYSLDI